MKRSWAELVISRLTVFVSPLLIDLRQDNGLVVSRVRTYVRSDIFHSKTSQKWSSTGPQLVLNWSSTGLHWSSIGLRLVFNWFSIGLWLVFGFDSDHTILLAFDDCSHDDVLPLCWCWLFSSETSVYDSFASWHRLTSSYGCIER